MSKVKWGFSFIFAVFLAGILGTAAFAIDPYGLQPLPQSDLSLKVNFTANPSASPGQDETTKFDLYLIHPTDSSKNKTYANLTVSKVTDSNTGAVTYPGSYTIPASDIIAGTVYKLELTLAGANPAVSGNILSSTSAVVIDSHNTSMYHLPDSHVDTKGSGLQNDNLTGYNTVNKARQGQKVHGFYQNNTNSCASCHQTHTAKDDSLLFKDGVYSTCSACHDGTTGAYNAFKPVDQNTPNSMAGTFDVLKDGHNGSLHVADGTLKVSAAPGGNINAPDGTPFSQDFDCASCHAPHGGGSNDENNLNIDPLGWGSVTFTNLPGGSAISTATNSQKDSLNGKLFKNIPIYDLRQQGVSIPVSYDPTGQNPSAGSTPYILVLTTTDSSQANVDANYFYKRAGVQANTPIIQTYRWGYDDKTHKDAYVPDYSLWLQEKGYPYKADTALYNDTWNNLSLTDADHYNDPAKDITRNQDVNVVWRDGFAWGPGVANVKSAQVSLGIDVETTDNIRSLYDSSYVAKDSSGNMIPTESYIPDSGTEMSKFCTACHTDYLSFTRTDSTGIYSVAHRHKTVDSLTCIRCHFAHGSEAQIMKDANDNTYYDLTAGIKQADGTTKVLSPSDAITYLLDPNPSSALKRYTGMSVCYACHGKGEQFMGNPNNTTDATIGQTLKAGEPGTPRK